MVSYKLCKDSDVIKKTDAQGFVWWVPNDPGNRDRQDYEAWLAQGNTPEPATADE